MSTLLLCNFNGYDTRTKYVAETNQHLTFVGTAQLDTAQKSLDHHYFWMATVIM